jgi:hypothetical protein
LPQDPKAQNIAPKKKKIFDPNFVSILSTDFDYNSKVYMDFLMKNKGVHWLVLSGEGSYEIPLMGIYNEV